MNLAKYLIFDRGDIENTILLTGSGRSGTTWLENLLNHDNSKRIIFEPFHNTRNGSISHWNPRQYLHPDENRPEYTEPLDEILSGKFRSTWSDQFNKKIIVSSRLIKAIRANFLLPWIHKRYPGIPIIFLMRHPCAVAYSRIQLGWEASVSNILAQKSLMKCCLEPFANILSDELEEFERHILVWCVENYVPLTQMKTGSMHVVFYEDLVLQKDVEIRSAFKAVGQTAPDLEKLEMNQPSALTRADSSINQGEDILKSWTKNIAQPQVDRAVDLLTQFGLNRIYNESIHPQMSADTVLGTFKAE